MVGPPDRPRNAGFAESWRCCHGKPVRSRRRLASRRLWWGELRRLSDSVSALADTTPVTRCPGVPIEHRRIVAAGVLRDRSALWICVVDGSFLSGIGPLSQIVGYRSLPRIKGRRRLVSSLVKSVALRFSSVQVWTVGSARRRWSLWWVAQWWSVSVWVWLAVPVPRRGWNLG